MARANNRQVTKYTSEERVKYVMSLIAKGYLTHQIISDCQKQWGIGQRAIEKYLTKVYALLKNEVSAADKDRVLVEYQALIQQCELSGDKKLAKEYRFQRDKILGLHTQKVEHSGNVNIDTIRLIEIKKEDNNE